MAYLDESGLLDLWYKIEGAFARRWEAIMSIGVTGTGGLKLTAADGQETVLTEYESVVTSVWWDYDTPQADYVTINFGHYDGTVDSIALPYRQAQPQQGGS